jgi:hypothetical protein
MENNMLLVHLRRQNSGLHYVTNSTQQYCTMLIDRYMHFRVRRKQYTATHRSNNSAEEQKYNSNFHGFSFRL